MWWRSAVFQKFAVWNQEKRETAACGWSLGVASPGGGADARGSRRAGRAEPRPLLSPGVEVHTASSNRNGVLHRGLSQEMPLFWENASYACIFKSRYL